MQRQDSGGSGDASGQKIGQTFWLLLSPGIIGGRFGHSDLTWAGPDEVCGSCRASKLWQSDAFAISWWGSSSRQFRLLVSKAKQVFISHRWCLMCVLYCFVLYSFTFYLPFSAAIMFLCPFHQGQHVHSFTSSGLAYCQRPKVLTRNVARLNRKVKGWTLLWSHVILWIRLVGLAAYCFSWSNTLRDFQTSLFPITK